jgi:hypothetical protein
MCRTALLATMLAGLFAAEAVHAKTVIAPDTYHWREMEKVIEVLKRAGGDPKQEWSPAWVAAQLEGDLKAGRLFLEDLEGSTLAESPEGDSPEIHIDPEHAFLPESMNQGWGHNPDTDYGFSALVSLAGLLAHEMYHRAKHDNVMRGVCNLGEMAGQGNLMEQEAWTYQIQFLDDFAQKYFDNQCRPLRDGPTRGNARDHFREMVK